MNRAIRIYSLLLKHFHSQGWWPTTPPKKIHPVYHSSPKVKALSESEKFEICIGAILTQNTAWSNVEKALAQLNKNKLMRPEKIARAPFAKLAKIILSSGYFREKTKKLKFFSKYLLKNYAGKVSSLLKKAPEETRAELLSLYGLGPETVDSILLYAGEVPIFVVDAYTRRIGNRVGLFHTDKYHEVQRYFHKAAQKSAAVFNEFHALLVALGKNICRAQPLCEKCPLNKLCALGRKNLRSGSRG